MKYVLVSGGVISGVGKGIIASSTGLLLKTIGLNVTSIKIDPYMNIDAGTMAPTEDNNITTGKVYQHVITRERKGDYLGKTVQVVPHVTNAIQEWVERVARIPVGDDKNEPDVCVIELGGTVGDIESAPFIHAMSQLQNRVGKNNFAQIHVSYVPVIPPGPSGEQKTKPTQRAVSDVRSAGLYPDLIACRCERRLEGEIIQKISNMCQVKLDQVIAVHNVSTTYRVPLLLEEQKLLQTLTRLLDLDSIKKPDHLLRQGKLNWENWVSLATSQDHAYDTVTIALVGKYVSLHDSYMSVSKSLEHAAMHCKKKLNLIWVDASNLENSTQETSPADYHSAWHAVCTADGILVPGGFGNRGTEGMIRAIKWARTKKVPYLGVCLGMQLAVVEYARNVCHLEDAGSEELSPDCKNKVIVYMPEVDKTKLGGTMRLGKRASIFQKNTSWSKFRALYGEATEVHERHRHRYEVNPALIDVLESGNGGLHFVGKDDKGERMEIVELKDHPWFVGVQFHPEYLSRVLAPSKTYLGFFAAAAGCLESITKEFSARTDLSHMSAKFSAVAAEEKATEAVEAPELEEFSE
ncbi:CTP synthase [Ascosphaera apis ARSEF 7405]|uniref:CTP synthase n=1 Tax=Ascosphaera apis ARSEF 7405 TaxID=392613 RepID=A0A167UWC1_9EURO|nr:CTP synthase [Ascosphaera apis ARSEF 7405]